MLRPMSDRCRALEKQLYQRLRRTCDDYQLLAPGDRVMVALSGGKDSYTLAHLLRQLCRALRLDVELVAVHLDQRQPGYDGAPLQSWLERSGFRFEILSEDTYSVVIDKLADNATYCSLCSRLRRGILYTAAERLGCNKIALGHHRDDALETFLMNLFYEGRLQAMPAEYTTDDGRFQVIRPLIECAEDQIAEFAALMEFPILPCNLCGSQAGLKRDAMAELLKTLERDNPHLRSIMLNALRNVKPTHLLDTSVREAWRERPPHLKPKVPPAQRTEHMRALPVITHTGSCTDDLV
jgi:tRNA 2-thiocytidine biosynthesis protein TtcA